jgi:hypothetical protein
MPTSVVRRFLQKLAKPANEIVAHFVLSILTILALAGTEFILWVLNIDNKMIPLFGITLGEWMFDLDLISATLINAVGIIKALIVLWKA